MTPIPQPTFFQRTAQALKYIFSYNWVDRSAPWFLGDVRNTQINYRSMVGDYLDSPLVMAALRWIMTAFPMAPPRYNRWGTDGKGGQKAQPVDNHPLIQLLKRPNPYYSGRLLWQATTLSFNLDGNAYWLLVGNSDFLRSGGLSGRPVQIWYEPHYTIRPVWPADPKPGDPFIAYYEVWRNNTWQRIETTEVIHFRDGIDPRNPRLGLPRLAPAVREVFTDNEAAQYSATVLKNMGLVGPIISPSGDRAISDPAKLKAEIIQSSTGDNRGTPTVISAPVNVALPTFSPEQMDVKTLRSMPEARVSSLLNIPAVVAGLLIGIEHMIYNNLSEAEEHAWTDNLIPTGALLMDELNTQLLPFYGSPETDFLDFDTSKIRALQDDDQAKAQQWATMYDSGYAKRSEAREAFNLPTDEKDEVYKSEAGARLMQETRAAMSPQNGNGAGAPDTVDALMDNIRVARG